MIVVMEPGATEEQIQHMTDRVHQLGLRAHVIRGTERTVIAAVGDERAIKPSDLETGPAVAEVLPILAPYKVASRELKPEPTQVSVLNFKAGAGKVGMIAGPCSVESEQQL